MTKRLKYDIANFLVARIALGTLPQKGLALGVLSVKKGWHICHGEYDYK